MLKNSEKGNFVEWLLVLVAISVVIFFIVVPRSVKNGIFGFSPIPNGSSTSPTTSNTPNQQGQTPSSKPSYNSQTSSTVVTNPISIDLGNAPSSNQPGEEYIVLTNTGSNSVDITGYRLQNAKSSRAYAVGSTEVHYASDTAIVPQGTHIIAASGKSVIGDIVLKPGERAVLTTGSPGNISPYDLVSFKENKCTGYLAETYDFSSGVDRQCGAPDKEPGASALDVPCQEYIDNMRSCHTPKFKDDFDLGPLVDNTPALSGACIAYIKAHYNYPACLVYHSGENSFESSTWQAYLYKSFEMWATSHETISLYNKSGQLIDSASY